MSQNSESATTGRWAEVFAPRYLPATMILALGVALLAFNAFLTSTAMPTAVQELGGVALIAWALTLFLVFAIMGGAGAALAKQVLGARLALLVSAGMFLTGSLVVGLAGSMEMVLAGRALQGLGEGLVAAICFALIPELFPARLVPKVFGMEAMVWAIAAFGGPVVAGLLTEFVSWRAAFLVSVPMALIFAGMVLTVVPDSKATARTPVDFPGVRLLLVGGGIMAVAVASLVPPLLAGVLLASATALLVGTVLLGLLSGQIALVLLAQITVGASYGMSNSSLYVTLMGASSAEERDRVAALVPTTQSAGNAIGAALAGLAANLAGYASAGSSAEFARAIVPVFAVGAGMAALAVMAAVRMTQLMRRAQASVVTEY